MRLLKKLPRSTQAFIRAALVAAGIGWPGAELEAAEGKAAVIWGSAYNWELGVERRIVWNGEILGSNVTQVAFGLGHGVARTSEGTVFCWGNNLSGQAANPFWVRDATAVAAALEFSAALKSDGTVTVWGIIPDIPPRENTNIVAITASTRHLTALRKNGTVVSWGNPSIQVPRGLSNVIEIVSGHSHSAALTQDGSVVAWGSWDQFPMVMPDGLTNVVRLISGPSSLFALKGDGSIVAWGHPNGTAHQVPSDLRDIVSLAAAFDFGLAAKRDGTMVVWGVSPHSQWQPPSGLSNVVQVAAAESAAAVLKNDGSIASWQQGYLLYPFQPVPLSAKGGGASAIVAGGNMMVALGAPTLPIITRQPQSRTVRQWQGAHFEVEAKGFGLTYQWRRFNSPIPNDANDVTYHVNGLQTGANFGVVGNYSVAIQSPDGRRVFSNLATLTVEAPIAPGTVVDWGPEGDPRRLIPEEIQERVLTIATSASASGAILNNGTVAVWSPGAPPRYRPPRGLPRATSVSLADFHAIVRNHDGTTEAWRLSSHRDWPIPQVAQSDVAAVSAAEQWTSVLKSNGMVWRWQDTQLVLFPASQIAAIADGYTYTVLLRNDGSVAQRGAETPPPPPLLPAVAVASGDFHAVALQNDGTVVAWGRNNAGQCDVPAGLNRVIAVAAGKYHTAALRDDGTVIAWGGHILDPYKPNQITPARVPHSLRGVTAIAAGGNRTLALLGTPATPLLTATLTSEGFAAIWPTTPRVFTLESSPSLLPGQWRPVPIPAQKSGLWHHVFIPRTDETLFFRLVQP